MSTNSADKTLLSAFPVPVLTLVAEGSTLPSFTSLRIVQRELNSNSLSVISTGAHTQWGHLALTMAPGAYLALTNGLAFAPPVHPGDDPVFAAGATAPLITETTRLFVKNDAKFRTYHAADQALKTLLLAACPKDYLLALENTDMGFGHVTTLQLLTHLWTTYGTITEADLDANLARLSAPWHPPTPIERFFKQIDEAASFAIAGECAIGERMLVNYAYNTILATGVFELACRDWRKLAPADKTLPRFKTHFEAANKDLALTTGAAGYHSANAAATAAEAAATKIAALEAAVAKLIAAASIAKTTPAATPAKSATAVIPVPGGGYCWTHGHSNNLSHSSATCERPGPGHQKKATAKNTMGGNPDTWVRRNRTQAVSATAVDE
jgi:hypothetical protein